MRPLHHTTCDFKVYIGYKNQLKICLSSMWHQLQDPTPHLSSYDLCVTIHQNIFLKSLPCEFPHRIFHQSLIICFLINDLLLSKFIQTCHTGRCIWTKNNLFVSCDGLFDGFFKLFLCFHTWRGIFNFFASSNSDVLFIYY